MGANREGKVRLTLTHLREDMEIFTYMYTKGEDTDHKLYLSVHLALNGHSPAFGKGCVVAGMRSTD